MENHKKWSKDNYGRLINLLTQISKLSYFNLLDLADFWCITVSLFIFWCGNRGCALIQPHTCACNMYIVLSMVINWQSRRFDHNDSHMPESVLYPSSCTCNSHIIKNKSFLAYFMRILNSCVVQQLSNCQAWASAIPAAYLLCSTDIRRDTRAAWCSCSCELLCCNVECVLLRGVVGRENVGTAFPHLFHVLLWNELYVILNGYFVRCVPTLFCEYHRGISGTVFLRISFVVLYQSTNGRSV